jgi:hypothetical protein
LAALARAAELFAHSPSHGNKKAAPKGRLFCD